jgi:hypothetical protein
MKPTELATAESSKVSATESAAMEPATAMETSAATSEMPAAPAGTTTACPCWLSHSNKSGDYQAEKYFCFHATNIVLKSRLSPLRVRCILFCLERGTEG